MDNKQLLFVNGRILAPACDTPPPNPEGKVLLFVNSRILAPACNTPPSSEDKGKGPIVWQSLIASAGLCITRCLSVLMERLRGLEPLVDFGRVHSYLLAIKEEQVRHPIKQTVKLECLPRRNEPL